jgi:hypothetical protein
LFSNLSNKMLGLTSSVLSLSFRISWPLMRFVTKRKFRTKRRNFKTGRAKTGKKEARNSKRRRGHERRYTRLQMIKFLLLQIQLLIIILMIDPKSMNYLLILIPRNTWLIPVIMEKKYITKEQMYKADY